MEDLVRGNPLRAAEYLFAFAFLFLGSGAILDLWRERTLGIDSHADGDPVRQAVWGGFFLVFTVILFRNVRQVLALLRNNLPLLALMALVTVSISWSFDPGLSFRRYVALAGTTLAGIYFATRFNLREFALLLLAATGVAAILTPLSSLTLPGWSIDESRDDSWTGVFNHRNQLARAMVLGALLTALVIRRSTVTTILLTPLVGLFTLNLLMSGSRTGFGALFGVAVLAIVAPSLFRRPILVPASLVMAGAALAVVLTLMVPQIEVSSIADRITGGSETVEQTSDGGTDTFRRVTGRSTQLTGRVPLWRELARRAADRPLAGYGVGGFWAGDASPGGEVWDAIEVWTPSHGHNGFLDLTLETGLIGLALFVAAFFLASVHSWNLARDSLRWYALVPGAILVFLVLFNVTESTLMRHSSLYWVLFVAVAFGAARWRDQERSSVDDSPARKEC